MKIHGKIRELCDKYKSEAYTVTTTKELAFKVSTQLKMLRELVESEEYLTYKIEPKFIDIGQAHRTVGISVQILGSASTVVAEAFGISTRYTYSIESKVKDATTEVAQTIALGKALSLLGFNASEGSCTYTKDEMTVFEKAVDKIDPVALRTKAAQYISELDEDLKKRMRVASMNIDIILDLVDIQNTTLDQLTKRIRDYLDTPKGNALNTITQTSR